MLHSENSTAPSPAQASSFERPDVTVQSAPKVPTFSREQQAFVIRLLKAERAHASRWWTFISEMRLRGDLPEWVARQEVGRHADHDRWNDDCQTTNRELLGISHHLNGFDPGTLVDETVGTWLRNEIVLDDSAPQTEKVPFSGAAKGVGYGS